MFNVKIVGIFAFVVSIMICIANDTIMKYSAFALPQSEIVFFRFLFSFLLLIPFIRMFTLDKWQTIFFNILRSILGCISILCLVYALSYIQITQLTIAMWSIPIFTIILSRIILKEQISYSRYTATFFGFIGLFILNYSSEMNNIYILMPIIAAAAFAIQDIIIKTCMSNSSNYNMLFYFAFFTSILCIPVDSMLSYTLSLKTIAWIAPTYSQLFVLMLLGIGSNLIQYLLLIAFARLELSAIAPIRYLDFIFANIADYMFFNTLISYNTWLAACILSLTTLYIGYTEVKNN